MATTNVIPTVLSNPEIHRYGRQMILEEIGLPGQEALKQAKVLIVGVGGLGCPSSQYLAAAGVGTLGLLDNDTVDTTNLHRQVLHGEDVLGVHKVDSAISRLRNLNCHVTYIPHKTALTSSNARSIISQYDVILDCTDNAATRYLINDCSVLLDKIVVSGAALRMEGQLSTYHFKGGPCYRCINPVPPNPDTTMNCFEAGVLGPVTGIIGSLQAAEAIKIITTQSSYYSGKLLLVNPWDGVMRTIKLRPQQASCAVCGTNPTVTAPVDYAMWCGSKGNQIVDDIKRVSCCELAKSAYTHLIDVRTEVEYGICRLANSVNAPFERLIRDKLDVQAVVPKDPATPVFVMCRRGNDSQVAVRYFQKRYPDHVFWDVIGGLQSWKSDVDPTFPAY